MLRRRIFSAAMASVMALSTVAVVAQAEETATQVKTKEDLGALLKEYDNDYRVYTLSDYPEILADAMIDALDAADAIYAATESDGADYTVAYWMVKAAANKLEKSKLYTIEDLKELVAHCEGLKVVKNDNIYNEELNDNICDPDTYTKLISEIEDAKDCYKSTNAKEITTAYVELDAALNGLKYLDVITKSQFRAVLQEYQAIFNEEFAYDEWRRGEYVWSTEVNDMGNQWVFQAANNLTASYGAWFDYCTAGSADIEAAYNEIDGIKGLKETTAVDIVNTYKLAKKIVVTFNAWEADDVDRATKSGISALINKYHGQLVWEFCAADVTTLETAIKTDASATVTYVDPSNGATDGWHVELNAGTGYDADGTSADGGAAAYVKVVAADYTVTLDKTVYVPVDDNGYFDNSTNDIITDWKAKAEGQKYQTIAKGSKFDLSKLIAVEVADIVDGNDTGLGKNADGSLVAPTTSAAATADLNANTNMDQLEEGGWVPSWGGYAGFIWGSEMTTTDGDLYTVSLADAMKLADIYLNGQYTKADYDKAEAAAAGSGAAIKANADFIKVLDTTGLISESTTNVAFPTGSTKELAMAYRALFYALTDRYAGTIAGVSEDSYYTKADVKNLIADSYKLIERTGDTAIFNVANVELAEALEDAIAWVAAAESDNLYKENTEGQDANGDTYGTSHATYLALNGFYTQLAAEEAALKYSFEEIYDKIGEVAEKIDDGEIAATDELLAAIEACAGALSDVAYETVTTAGDYDDNYAFDDERAFEGGVNRVVTGDVTEVKTLSAGIKLADNPTHATLKAAYEALLAAAKKAADVKPDVLLGDANGDGDVNATDASAILMSLVGLGDEIDEDAADFDEDGDVDADDASALLKSLVL